MNSQTENTPAFPLQEHGDARSVPGMTLRDYFAAQLIGPLMASDGFEARIMEDGFPIDQLPKFAAQTAYEIADAMLKERNQPK